MSYKLTPDGGVMRIDDCTHLPVKWVDGKPVPLDEYSPLVKEFSEWVAQGNVPEAADEPVMAERKPTLDDVVAVLSKNPDIKAQLDAAAALSIKE